MDEIKCKQNVAHYTSCKHIKKIFSSKKLRLSKVAGFDDPRESSISWLETVYIGNSYKLIDLDCLKQTISKKINILCCCAPRRYEPSASEIEQASYGRPRMWSQYGDKAKGICLILDRHEITKQISQYAKQPDHFINEDVEYKDWLHLIHGNVTLEITDSTNIEEVDLFSQINENEMLKHIYFNKGIDWKDESEYRWLLFNEQEDDIYIDLEPCIKSVVLGVNYPINRIKEIKKYCRSIKCSCYQLGYSHPKYFLQKIKL